MLSGQYFYYRTIRRNVIAFGTLFKHIQLVKYAYDTFNEISRVTVPLSYAPKENFLVRIEQNYDLHKPTQINLPRMSFLMTSIEYDKSRKLSSFNSSFTKQSQSAVNQQYSGVPYDIGFELNIYARNVEDGTQIVEQILPYFNPDYTLSMNFVDTMDITRDVPIILENIEYAQNYEGPAETTVRTLVWTLTFKMKTYFFGPINTGSLIRDVNVNNIEVTPMGSNLTINLTPGLGDYKIGDIVYQGSSLPIANVTATVTGWSNTNNILTVTNVNGVFSFSSNVVSVQSKTSRSVSNILFQDQLLQHIEVTPRPPSANLGDDFGFTTTITEYGNP
jgi:T4-like virus Myoviridae tail sheath stabiliser